jgi:hypothetical protein
MRALLLTTVIIFSAASISLAKASYVDTVIQGWTIKINTDLVHDHKEIAAGIVSVLEGQLKNAVLLLPSSSLEQLRKAPIWVEFKSVNPGLIQYHRSAGWLKEHDQDPAKENCIELSAPEYISDGTVETMLHELALVYYYRVLGSQNTDILAAFGSMMSNKLYKNHPAMQNDAGEYFSSLSSQYFMPRSANIRAEMKKYDALGVAMIEKYWLQK